MTERCEKCGTRTIKQIEYDPQAKRTTRTRLACGYQEADGVPAARGVRRDSRWD